MSSNIGRLELGIEDYSDGRQSSGSGAFAKRSPRPISHNVSNTIAEEDFKEDDVNSDEAELKYNDNLSER